MAKASAQITLHYVIDIKASYRYYLLQGSTLAKPFKPTTFPPPSTWNDTEPTYTSGSTNSLYFVDCTVFANNSFKYSEVSLSTSYEAAKEAYNKADNAEKQITIQSATEPPTTTCMWLDTGVEPPMLKRYNSETSSWEPINDTSAINSSIAALEKHMYAKIAQTKESITSTVAQKYYLKEDAEKLASDISTQFTQTSEGFEMKFNQFNADLEGLAKGTDAEFEEIRKHIRFINGKILLGEVGNQLELEISNNMISFIQSGVPVAWFTDNKLYVKDGEFTNSLRLGNFTYLPRSNGNLSFKKI